MGVAGGHTRGECCWDVKETCFHQLGKEGGAAEEEPWGTGTSQVGTCGCGDRWGMENLQSGGVWVVLCFGGASLWAVGGGAGGGRRVSEAGLAGPGLAGGALVMAGGRMGRPGTRNAPAYSRPQRNGLEDRGRHPPREREPGQPGLPPHGRAAYVCGPDHWL